MSKKLIVHCCLLGALIIYTMFAWSSVKSSEERADEVAREARENGGSNPWEDLDKVGNTREMVKGMIKVGIPLLVSTIYGGILVVIYLLPVIVDRVGEEIMGSSAKVDDDPLEEARDAVAEGEYPEAIAVYRKFWLENRDDRRPLIEIAKIQREHLESPAAAVNTLEEGLKGYEWPEDDASFLMFRIAEIHEEDLQDEKMVIESMKRVVEDLPGTRHAGNAAQKLKEMEAS